MKLCKDYAASHAVFTLEEGETLHRHVLVSGIQFVTADLAGFWNVDLEILPGVLAANQEMLTSLDFAHAGTISTNNITLVRLRKSLRKSSDGGQAVSPDHVLRPNPSPASAEELAARELVSRITTDGVEAKADRIKKASALMFEKKIEPVEVPEFVSRKNFGERKQIEAAIDRLSRRPESA